MSNGIRLTKNEIEKAFSSEDLRTVFPPILSTKQVHQLLQVSPSTFALWKAQGLFKGAYRRHGKRVRYWRDRVIECFFNK